MWQLWKSLVLIYNSKVNESLDFIIKNVKEPGQDELARLILILKYSIYFYFSLKSNNSIFLNSVGWLSACSAINPSFKGVPLING